MVLFPNQLRFRDILIKAGSESEDHCCYLPFSPASGGVRGARLKTMMLLWKVWRLLEGCNRVDLFFLSPKLDWPTVYAAAVICRLKGVPPILHDFSFHDETAVRRRRLLQSLCATSGDSAGGGSGVCTDDFVASALRSFGQNRGYYRRARKDRAVPHVIIVSDGENGRMMALAKRAFGLVKQKYPRTEFILAAVTEGGISPDDAADGAISRRVVAGEDDLASLFGESDIAVFLSSGGINELFVARARAAGFPVIANGFGFAVDSGSSVRPVVIPRDSYSALAEAIIRLVDDDVYYRSFVTA
ncbi:MAG: hypothetical protein PHR28_11970 [candidate division Zixibacteria bacterium]|nr:hypothetical protein [candidate division Zixibacteria bacterium]